MLTPPPPIPEDAGCITASANAAAIAASTAFPPRRSTAIAASVANRWPVFAPAAPSAGRGGAGGSVRVADGVAGRVTGSLRVHPAISSVDPSRPPMASRRLGRGGSVPRPSSLVTVTLPRASPTRSPAARVPVAQSPWCGPTPSQQR